MNGGIIAAIVIAVIVFLLSIPLVLSFRLEVYDEFDYYFGFTWLFGLVKKEFGQGKRPAEKKPAEEKPAERKTKRSWSFFDLIRIRGLLGRLLRLVRDVLGIIKIRKLEIDFAVGLGDPADTAILVGSLWLPGFLLRHLLPYPVSLRPVLTGEPCFRGHTYAAITLRPIQIVPALVRFGFSMSAMRLLGVLLFSRWKRRK